MDGRSWPIDLIVDQLHAEFDRQDKSAVKWLSNPYCADSQTGRNVARDELLPSAYMRRKTSKPHAENHPADYIGKRGLKPALLAEQPEQRRICQMRKQALQTVRFLSPY